MKDLKEYKLNIKDFDKKEELLKSALIEFSENSYDDASLNNILVDVGLSKGSFYYHFQNKQDLYLFLISEVTNAKMDFMSKEMKNYGSDLTDRNIFSLLKIYGRMGFKFAKTHPLYYQFANKYIKEKNTQVKDNAKKYIEPVSNSLLNDLISNAISKGELRNDFSVEFTTKLFIHLFKNYDEIVFQDTDNLEVDEMVKVYDDYLDFIENGLGNK